MITDLVSTLLPDCPVIVATIGFPTGSVLRLQPESGESGPVERLDLDAADPGDPPAFRPGAAVAIIGRTWTDLRRAVSVGAVLPPTRFVAIAVTDSSGYRPYVPTESPERRPFEWVKVYREPTGGWAVGIRMGTAEPAGQILTATILGRAPNRSELLPRVALTGSGSAHWRPGDPCATPTTPVGPLSEPDRLTPADLVLRSVRPAPPQWGDPRAKVIDRPQPDLLTWSTLGGPGGLADTRAMLAALGRPDSVPPVDEHAVNPSGFVFRPRLGSARLSQSGDCWAIRAERLDPVTIHHSGLVTDVDVARLRQVRVVTVDWGRHTGPIAAVRTIAGLAAAGVPLHAPAVPRWASALGPELVELITKVQVADLDDNLSREEHSIRLRRAAMRWHSTRARWRDLVTSAGVPAPAPPRISILLCTRRPDLVAFALAQIARQRWVDLEVILTLHGVPAAHPEARKAVAGFDLPLTILEVPADVVFGEALNRAARVASGQYLAKWDDDDWYGPEFLADMAMAAHYSGADLVGCFGHLLYLEQINLTLYRPDRGSERAGLHVAGATMLLARDALLTLGGFRPLPRYVDTAIQRAVTASGGLVYRTHGLGFMFRRRATGHTWNQSINRFLRGSARQWRGFRPRPLMEPCGPGGPQSSGMTIADDQRS